MTEVPNECPFKIACEYLIIGSPRLLETPEHLKPGNRVTMWQNFINDSRREETMNKFRDCWFKNAICQMDAQLIEMQLLINREVLKEIYSSD